MKQKTRFFNGVAVVVMILVSVLLLNTLVFIGKYTKYSHYTVSSVIVELIFTLLTLSTFINVNRSGHRERLFVRLYLWMLVIITLGMLGDIFSWGVGLESFCWSSFAQSLGSFIRDAMGFPLIVLYSIYLLSYINEDPKELQRYAWLVGGLCADGLFLVLINQITSRSSLNPWHMWDYPWLFFFFITVPIVVTIGIIFHFRRLLTNRKTFVFLFYELLVLATVALDILLQEITLAYVAAAFSLFCLYISVQMEYEKQQEEALLQQKISIMLSQIRPHFLYNVLTGIRALCRLDPDRAEDALVDFTSYLRANLNSLETEHLIPFSLELEHTEHYIHLEQMRYGADLKVVLQTSVTDFSIPPLSMEPIVENAVRHGIMQREQGGTITIHTKENNDFYSITITDDGIGFDTSSLDLLDSTHVGISNVQKRLAAMCGGSLVIHSTPGYGTIAVISIPK